jgi:hydrogenase expression/formation protein HypE
VQTAGKENAMNEGILAVGKLPMGLLQALLEQYGGRNERLVVGPRVGEDAAVLDMGERYLVVKSDPITFATEEIGWYVVHINANDLATMGATPRWLLLTLLLPEQQTTQALVEAIFGQVSQACQMLGVVLCGGHTEITHGLDRPIAVGLMLGEVEKADLVCTSGAQAGDDVILTKGIAIEGTAVLAREVGERLSAQVGDEVVARGRRFLQEPGISVLRDAAIVRQVARPHAMHDPTEGGLATGLWEMAHASGKGIVVDLDQIHVFSETALFCQALGLDPLGLIASGALLVTAAPEDLSRMLEALAAAGIGASVIGQVVEGPPLVQVRTARGLHPLPTFDRDELARVFD